MFWFNIDLSRYLSKIHSDFYDNISYIEQMSIIFSFELRKRISTCFKDIIAKSSQLHETQSSFKYFEFFSSFIIGLSIVLHNI